MAVPARQGYLPGPRRDGRALIPTDLGDGRADDQVIHQRVVLDGLPALTGGVVHPPAGPLDRLRPAGRRPDLADPQRVLRGPGRHVGGADHDGGAIDEHAVPSLDPDARVLAPGGRAATGGHVRPVALEAAAADDDRGPPGGAGRGGIGDQDAVLGVALGRAADELGGVPVAALVVDQPAAAPAQVGPAADVGHVPRRPRIREEAMAVRGPGDIAGVLDVDVVDVGVVDGPVHRRLAGALEHAAAHPQPVAINPGRLVVGQPVAADQGDRDMQNLQAVDIAVAGDPVHIGR